MQLNALHARKHEYRVLGLMLLLLHIAIWGDFAGAASRSLMLAHLGLFILWQPIWRKEQRLQASVASVALLLILAFVGWLDWWVVTIWLLLLIGLVGGRNTDNRKERTIYMMSLVFLASELLLGALPETFNVELPYLPTVVATWGLPLMPLAIMCFSASEASHKTAQAVDFLYGVTISLLIGVLGLGSLLRMYDGGVHYAVALFQTTLAVAAFMFAISWLWAPFGGFSGLGQMWTRYLMNIGTPFEQWLGRISSLSRRRAGPDEFLDSAMGEFLGLPWVNGASWTTPGQTTKTLGHARGYEFGVLEEGLQVTVYTLAPAGTSLVLHGRLLVGLLSHFYRAKQREAELTRHAHLEAVHETGARLTHDIKNLLQSLHTTTSAMECASTPEEREAVHGLVERQLPTLTQRLHIALEKLQRPEVSAGTWVTMEGWWRALAQRHSNTNVLFNAGVMQGFVPSELFDGVLENLLENAIYKQRSESDVDIRVVLRCEQQRVEIDVIDTGSAIDSALRRDLMRGPVVSRSGFGIGLYQASRQAEQMGYELALISAEAGKVCFRLRGPLAGAPNPVPAHLAAQ